MKKEKPHEQNRRLFRSNSQHPKQRIFHFIEFLLIFLFVLSFLDKVSAGIEGPLKKTRPIHKNDVVIMTNGDRNTGETKKMQFGVLYLKSDLAADTLKLDWERVAGVESIARYEFEVRNKDIYVGTIAKDPNEEFLPGELSILLDDGSTVPSHFSNCIGANGPKGSTAAALAFTFNL